MIKILAGGKKSTQWLAAAINEYEKRLRSPFRCEWIFCDSSKLVNKIQQLPKTDFVILLDEAGIIMTSETLAQSLYSPISQGQNLIIVIGDAFGHFSPEVKQRANLIWSLSKLVFPHQICRLLVIEQIYRAQEIINHHPYHHA